MTHATHTPDADTDTPTVAVPPTQWNDARFVAPYDPQHDNTRSRVFGSASVLTPAEAIELRLTE